jgi:hypothetical protein
MAAVAGGHTFALGGNLDSQPELRNPPLHNLELHNLDFHP